MKSWLTVLFLFGCIVAVCAQENLETAKAILYKIKTINDLVEFITKHPGSVEIRTFSSEDTTKDVQQLLTRSPGDIFLLQVNKKSFLYKIDGFSDEKKYRIQYLSLKTNKYSLFGIDSL